MQQGIKNVNKLSSQMNAIFFLTLSVCCSLFLFNDFHWHYIDEAPVIAYLSSCLNNHRLKTTFKSLVRSIFFFLCKCRPQYGFLCEFVSFTLAFLESLECRWNLRRRQKKNNDLFFSVVYKSAHIHIHILITLCMLTNSHNM